MSVSNVYRVIEKRLQRKKFFFFNTELSFKDFIYFFVYERERVWGGGEGVG